MRLLLVDLGEREPDVDEHPVVGAHVVEEPDVDVPEDTGDLDLRQLVALVRDLDDPAGNREAHQRVLSNQNLRLQRGRRRTNYPQPPTRNTTECDALRASH